MHSFYQQNTTQSGRDENVSKMDVDSVNRRPERRPVSGRRRPVEKLSLVNVDQ